MKSEPKVITLDLLFLGIPNTIAAYLIPHPHGAVLIECGPGSTTQTLEIGLNKHNLTPQDITDVLLTHIHLDHAGASGWLAQHGARIYVHHIGAPHMAKPDKLLSSASRIYGDSMDLLWGEFLPVPEYQLISLNDGDVIEIEGLRFTAIDTPGHAYHHMSYRFEDFCFTGDVGGVRIIGQKYLRLPTPPPEFHPGKWKESLSRLYKEEISFVAPTHFGIHHDPDWHLDKVQQELLDLEQWIDRNLSTEIDINNLRNLYSEWIQGRAKSESIDPDHLESYDSAIPSWMSADGIWRYWRKQQSG
jgi:glyoxylase-like metal-dependent hydrolase (beta-lactamase superfamily II)